MLDRLADRPLPAVVAGDVEGDEAVLLAAAPWPTARPASSWRSAITTVAPASASALAIPSPSPWAPPVTSALRPDSSNTLMATLLG